MPPPNRRAPSAVDKLVGQRVRAAREMRGMRQERLAELLDLSFQQIQKYEAGKNRISASRLHVIAAILSVPIEFFYKGVGEDPESGEIRLLRAVLAVPSDRRRVLLELAEMLIQSPAGDGGPAPAAKGAPAPRGAKARSGLRR
jgi:transcriptional regulator with XRE-family HTH domain